MIEQTRSIISLFIICLKQSVQHIQSRDIENLWRDKYNVQQITEQDHAWN